MNLTIDDIEADIEDFQGRIAEARSKLKALPSGRLPFEEYRTVKKQRQSLESDIKHLERLIGYASEGISIRR